MLRLGGLGLGPGSVLLIDSAFRFDHGLVDDGEVAEIESLAILPEDPLLRVVVGLVDMLMRVEHVLLEGGAVRLRGMLLSLVMLH
jgi:hypothetical protein